jgi:YHS domain-containing protein
VFRLLFLALLFYIGYRIVVALMAPKKSPAQPAGSRDNGETAHRDPVCGLYVSEESAVVGRYNGERHYFCSMNCLEKYREQLD